MAIESRWEETLIFQIKALKIPLPVREWRFHPLRKWRFDFAWPTQKVAVEVEGGIYSNGRHTRGSAFEADAEKYNTAALMGWRVFRFGPKAVQSGRAAEFLIDAFSSEEMEPSLATQI